MSSPDNGPGESLTADQAFDLLSDDTRRRALAALQTADGSMSLDELAAVTVAREKNVPAADVSTDRRKRTAAMLHHSHLPRLADADVVVYDHPAGPVELTEVADELEPYIELTNRE